MRVEVLINGFIGRRFVQERLAVELSEGATLQELLAEVKWQVGLDLTKLDEAGPVVMLSGRRLELPADLETRLRYGDLLTVLSPLSGGWEEWGRFTSR